MDLESKIEAILFFKGEPVSIKRLSQILKLDEGKIEEALLALSRTLEGRGLVIMRKDDEAMLGTAPAFSFLIEELTREELTREIGKAGLETLSIVLYKGPITRREIDYIRGVNSTFILRNLLIRGLVEKITSPEDQRSYLYKATFELLQFMGLTKITDLPEYESVRKTIDDLELQSDPENKGEAVS